jgi:uridine phosphorylase
LKKTIADSELILNKDGSVYHLGLRPSQVSDLLITVGDPDRIAFFKPFFSKITHQTQLREFHSVTGTIQGREMTIISTGIGTDNIDIVLNEYDALFNIDFEKRQLRDQKTSCTIVRLGTSGALQQDIEPGTLLVSDWAIGLDGLLHSYHRNAVDIPELEHALRDYLLPHNPGLMPYVAEGDPNLRQLFGTADFISGITLTANGFYAPQDRDIRLRAAKNNLVPLVRDFIWKGQGITNMEMETSGIYGLAGLLGHRAVSLNALLANRARGTFVQDPEKVVKDMVSKALEILATSC